MTAEKTTAEKIVTETDDRDALVERIAEKIVAASQDQGNWEWRDSDDACGGNGFSGGRLLNGGSGIMWCGDLSVPGLGTLALAACVDISRDGIETSFGSGCRDGDIGECTPDAELTAALDGITYGDEAAEPAVILADAAWVALDKLTAEGLDEIIDAKCRALAEGKVAFAAIYDAIVEE
jgi:hypothetical protein